MTKEEAVTLVMSDRFRSINPSLSLDSARSIALKMIEAVGVDANGQLRERTERAVRRSIRERGRCQKKCCPLWDNGHCRERED